MKYISYEKYCKIKDALCEFVDKKKDPYKYLFELINGYPEGTQRTHDMPRKVISLSMIKEIWDTPVIYKRLAELAILKHYKGHSVSTSPMGSEIVNQDTIIIHARKILKKFKEQ